MQSLSSYMYQLDKISEQISEEDNNQGINKRGFTPLTRREMEELQSYLYEQKVAYEREHRTFLSEEQKRKQRM